MWWLWVILGIIALVVIYAVLNQIKTKTKCESCGKYFALNVLSKNEIGRRSTTKTVTETERYRYGTSGEWRTRQVQKQVPAEAIQYRIESVCKHCGQHKTYTTEETHRI